MLTKLLMALCIVLGLVGAMVFVFAGIWLGFDEVDMSSVGGPGCRKRRRNWCGWLCTAAIGIFTIACFWAAIVLGAAICSSW